MGRFLGFLLVGAFGFLVDASVLWAALHWTGPYLARFVSFTVAVTFTYVCNRQFVFQRGRNRPGWLAGFGRFVLSNSAGGLINLGVYSLLVFSALTLVSNPIIATGIGSVCGALVNFTLTSLLVFPSAEADENGPT